MEQGEQAASSIFQEIKYIELDGIMGNEQVIIEGSTNPEEVSYTSFIIQRFDMSILEWITEYVWTIDELIVTDVENGYWNISGAPVVILKATQGSGEWLSYRVVGYRDGKLQELIVRENILQGNAFLYGGGIFEQSGNQYYIWTVVQGELKLIPY